MGASRSRRARRFPWEIAAPGLVVGAIVGALAAVFLGTRFAPVDRPDHVFPDEWTYRFTGISILVVAVVGSIIAASGFVWRTDRQLWNYLLIGAGVGIAAPGSSYLALEKVEVTRQGFHARQWWRLRQIRIAFDDVRLITETYEERPGRRRPIRRSLLIQTRDGREFELINDTHQPHLYTWSTIHLKHAAGRHGVEMRRAPH